MEDLITTREAAQILGVSPKTLVKWRERELFGCVFFPADFLRGKTWFYERERVEQLQSVYHKGVLANMYKLAALGEDTPTDYFQKRDTNADIGVATPPVGWYNRGFLTVSQVAEKFGVDQRTVRRWTEEGTLRWDRYDHANRWLFKKETIENFTPPGTRKIREEKPMIFNYSDQDAETISRLSLEEREDLKRRINSTSPLAISVFTPAQKQPTDNDKCNIICPNCGNGTGKDGTPVEVNFKNGKWLYYCHVCGKNFSGDLFEVIAHDLNLNKTDKHDVYKILAAGVSCCNIAISSAERKQSQKPVFDSAKAREEKELADRIANIIKAHIERAEENFRGNLLSTAEMKEISRGLTAETLMHFHCGYLEDWTHPRLFAENKKVSTSRRLIIPTSQNHYLACAIDRDKVPKNFWKPHAGKKELFNSDALKSAKLVIVVEGEIDAMSVWQAFGGKIAVVATCSAPDYKTLLSCLKTCAAGTRFIILFDNDKAGETNSKELQQALKDKGFAAVCRSYYCALLWRGEHQERVPFEFQANVDANDILQKDELFLREVTQEIIDKAQDELETVEQEIAAQKAFLSSAENSLTEEQIDFLFDANRKLSDVENSNRIAYLYSSVLKFVTDRDSFIVFDGGCWKQSAEKNSVVYPFIRKFQARVKPYENRERGYIGRIFNSAQRVNPAIQMLKGHSDIRISAQDLDNHKHLLNVLNGVVDLQTGKFYEARPELLLTRQCRADFIPECNAPIVEKFLADILPDENSRAALIRWLGYCLTGEISEQAALFATGGGSNGKSTLLEMLLLLLGNYATKLSVKAIVECREADANAATTHLNVLEGVRLAVVNEFKPNYRLDEQRFKELTGDREILIRKLHHEAEKILNQAKLFLCGNDMPRLTNSQSYAIRRRIKALDFGQTFSEELGNIDFQLAQKLSTPAALSTLLNILVNGAREWYQACADGGKSGLIESAAMQSAKEKYLTENDFISDFVDEYCIVKPDAVIKQTEFIRQLKEKFPSETSKSNIRPRDLTMKVISKLAERGIEHYNDSHLNSYVFKGLGVLSERDL